MSVNRVTLVEVDQVSDDYQKHLRHLGVHDGPCGEGTGSSDERRWVGDWKRFCRSVYWVIGLPMTLADSIRWVSVTSRSGK